MSRHVAETGHTAFTWTGPYGSGKSSLVVALCAAMAASSKSRDAAVHALGEDVTAALWDALPLKSQGWRILPVIGRRAPLAQVVGEALEERGLVEASAGRRWTDAAVLNRLAALAAEHPRTHGGLIVINSAEPHGLHDFLSTAALSDLYTAYTFRSGAYPRYQRDPGPNITKTRSQQPYRDLV